MAEIDASQILDRLHDIQDRLNEIADLCEAEEREMNNDEEEEVKTLQREAQLLRLRASTADMNGNIRVNDREVQFDNKIKEALKHRQTLNVALRREAMLTTTSGVDGLVPLTIDEIIKPLEDGLILSTVGVRLRTGLAGDYVSPIVGKVEASFAEEAVALTDTEIPLSKLKPTPQRLGISVTVTNQTINQTLGVVRDIVLEQITMGVTRTLNKVMFSPTKINDTVKGPFAEIIAADKNGVALSSLTTKAKKAAAKHVKFAGALPTYAELLAMRGIALAKGVINDGTAAYIMDEYTKAALESTPRDAGSGLMIVEDGKIGGVPVYCTNYINDDTSDHIGFGIFSYELLGQFGDMRFTVDPLSEAKKDVVLFTLNGDWSMTTARAEAFVLGTPTVATGSAID